VPTTKARRATAKARDSRPHAVPIDISQSPVKDLAEDLARAPRSLITAIRDAVRSGSEGVKCTILTRSLSLTGHAMEHIPNDILVDAAAAPTDKEVLLRILEAPQMAVPNKDAATIEASRAAGVVARDQLINAHGGSWPVEQVAKYLGLTRQAVDKRRKANKLIGLAIGRHGYLYPSWQFDRSGTLPGLEDVLHELRRLDPWSQLIFLLSPNDRLDGASPLEALRKGQINDVKVTASLFGEHGAA